MYDIRTHIPKELLPKTIFTLRLQTQLSLNGLSSDTRMFGKERHGLQPLFFSTFRNLGQSVGRYIGILEDILIILWDYSLQNHHKILVIYILVTGT
jgi:hypothetical protein